jgi:hypothetical protein
MASPRYNDQASPLISMVYISSRTSQLRSSEVCSSGNLASLDFRNLIGFQDNPPAPSLDLTVIKGFPFLLNRPYGSHTPSVELFLFVVKYHAGCGFILLLLLLSFVTGPSNSLALINILRFEIGSI